MALVDRVKNILLTPKSEWVVIDGETTSTADLLKNYVAILAAIPAVCGFIGMSLIGFGAFGISIRTPIVAGIVTAIFSYVMSFVTVIVVGHIIDALAPTFGAQKNLKQATKVAAYAFTAAWVGGIFSLLPALSVLGILTGLYSIFLLYLGLPVLMKNPEDKSIGYTAVVVVATIVVSIIIGVVAAALAGMSGASRGMFGGVSGSSRSANVTIDPDSKLAKLEAFGKQMEEAGKKMEAAQKSGNQEEAAKAAMNVFGAAMGGGKSIDPLGIELLKPFVPETFAGLGKKSSKAEKTGAMGIMVSKAEARYADETGAKSINLEVSDTGGAAGWMTFASWAMVEGEKEDQYGKEKTGTVDGRIVHEKSRKDGGSEYDIVLGKRFIVTAKSNGVDLNTLKTAVASLDLAKLESMKDVGVQK
ncbi:MAG: YIP1 family protein [Betaproteobacteria bacterium]